MLASLSNLLSGTFHGDTVGEKDTAIGGQHVEGAHCRRRQWPLVTVHPTFSARRSWRACPWYPRRIPGLTVGLGALPRPMFIVGWTRGLRTFALGDRDPHVYGSENKPQGDVLHSQDGSFVEYQINDLDQREVLWEKRKETKRKSHHVQPPGCTRTSSILVCGMMIRVACMIL